MIIMDVKLDNFLSFKNFHINMSYPKKIVDSYIENEHLSKYPNFRYKKVNILMGANATGKTSFGKMLMHLFNFMDGKEYSSLTSYICDSSREACFSMDFVVTDKDTLYKIEGKIAPRENKKYTGADIDILVRSVRINQKDSYESCLNRLLEQKQEKTDNYVIELEKIQGLSWLFEYPLDSKDGRVLSIPENTEKYGKILEKILRTLDPSIEKVEKIKEVEKAYVIRTKYNSVIIQKGQTLDTDLLSSGTKAGIGVAGVVTSILEGNNSFYYCDEKFSYIHSDVEKALLLVMINSLMEDDQFFFTTHNVDILDLPLPKHSFTFLKKDMNNAEMPIECISASSILKRNTDSLKKAVENDLFSIAPATDLIYEITDL